MQQKDLVVTMIIKTIINSDIIVTTQKNIEVMLKVLVIQDIQY